MLSSCVWVVVAVCARLRGTGKFDTMSLQVDEDEHSIEMHLPYVAKVMERYVPILRLF